jgi:hypothetical protein
MSEFPTQGIRPLWIASYPRSGNTFLRIILENSFHLPSYSVYHLEGDKHPDPSAEALESAPLLPQNWRDLLRSAGDFPVVPIKTHGPPTDEARAIFIARDGRAAISSYYHYHKKFAFEQPSLTEVIAGACQFGSWSDHYWAWHPRTRPNTLLLQYEELVSRPEEIIPGLSKFLGLEPKAGSLPKFDELQQRSPAFFRRGRNADYLNEWTPLQMALFNQIHAAAMGDLGFPLVTSAEPATGAINELAQSAARLHRMYLQQLSNVGRSIADRQQDVQRLSGQVREISQPIEQILKPMLKTRWVRLGMAIGTLPKVNSDQLPASPPVLNASSNSHATGNLLRSSDENSQSPSPDLRTKQPSAPSGGIAARG